MEKQEHLEIENKIRELMSLLLRIDAGKIDDSTTSHSVTKWDSLQHMNLMAVIEEEFDIQLDPRQIRKMNSFRNIKIEVFTSLHLNA